MNFKPTVNYWAPQFFYSAQNAMLKFELDGWLQFLSFVRQMLKKENEDRPVWPLLALILKEVQLELPMNFLVLSTK